MRGQLTSPPIASLPLWPVLSQPPGWSHVRKMQWKKEMPQCVMTLHFRPVLRNKKSWWPGLGGEAGRAEVEVVRS